MIGWLASLNDFKDANKKDLFPEKALITAVILRAVQDVLNAHNLKYKVYSASSIHNTPPGRILKHSQEAKEWLYSKSTEPFSFIWCCQQLFDVSEETLSAKILSRIEYFESIDEPLGIHYNTYSLD